MDLRNKRSAADAGIPQGNYRYEYPTNALTTRDIQEGELLSLDDDEEDGAADAGIPQGNYRYQYPTNALTTRDEDVEDLDGGDETGDGEGGEEADQFIVALRALVEEVGIFQPHTLSMTVHSLFKWFVVGETCGPDETSLVIPDHLYQRNYTTWSKQTQKDYLLALLRNGPACNIPIVVSRGPHSRVTTRIVDGAHRVHTIVSFIRNELPLTLPMLAGDRSMKYSELCEKDPALAQQFRTRMVSVTVYPKLTEPTEMELFVSLNSGLPMHLGELLGAHRSCPGLVRQAYNLSKKNSASFAALHAIVESSQRSCVNDRGGKLQTAVILAWNLWQKPRHAEVVEYIWKISDLGHLVNLIRNQPNAPHINDPLMVVQNQDALALVQEQLGARCDFVLGLFDMIRALFDNDKQRCKTTKLTDMRLFVICQVLGVEIMQRISKQYPTQYLLEDVDEEKKEILENKFLHYIGGGFMLPALCSKTNGGASFSRKKVATLIDHFNAHIVADPTE